jgi:hypothetical protein
MGMDYYALNNMSLDDDDDFEEDLEDSDEMSETTVTEEGALSQIGSSFKGMLIGFLCFIVSFIVLWCGATRIDWSREFKGAVPAEKASGDEAAYVTGTPVADEIGNTYLSQGKYLKISKTPEVYAYVERTKSKSETKREGVTRKKVTKTKTTYSYVLEWTTNPKDISGFNQQYWNKFARNRGISPSISNPTLTEKPDTIYTPKCTVNGYSIDVSKVSFMGGSQDLDLVYVRGSKGSPRLGDMRMRYTVIPSDTKYTFAGSVSGKKMDAYYRSDDDYKFAAVPGEFKDLLKALKQSYKTAGMIYFWGGFLLMAIGLVLLAGPVTTLLEFIPFLGGLGSGVIKVVLVIIALILSAVFYWLIKLWWLWLIIVALLIALIIFKKRSAKPAEA